MVHLMTRGRRLVALVLLAAVVAACGGGGDDARSEADPTTPPDAPADGGSGADAAAVAEIEEPGDWTMLVYVAADNDLEPFAVQDLSEMAEASGVEIVALVDRNAGYTADDALGLGDWEDTRLLHISDGEVEVVGEPGELDTGDPAVLADFVAEGLREHGSERNGLVIWNHGGSWPGAAVDETSGGTMLSVAGISEAIADGLERAGVDQLDLIGFDACLMATYEVAANLAPVARTLLASEELEPGHGWNWTAMSAPDGGVSTIDLAEAVMDGFLAQSEEQATSGITLSLVDLAQIGEVSEAFDALAAGVDADASGLVGRIGHERAGAIGFGRDPDPAYDLHMVDVGHLAERLADIEPLAGAAGDLRAAVDAAVLLEVTDATTAQATGLSVYFPPVASLGEPGYEDVAGIDPWVGFLRAYYTGAEGVPSAELPAFLDDDRYIEDAEVDQSEDGLSFSADLVPGTGVNVASAKVFWGQVDMEDTDLVAFYGERPAPIDGDTIHAEYDWRYLVIGDGQDEAPAYTQLDVGDDGELRRIVVPITYTRGEESLRGVLVLGVDGGDVASQTFYGYGEGGTVGEIRPAEGDLFMPRLLLQDLSDFSSEWVDSAAVPLWADPTLLEYRMPRLASATPVMIELGLTDIEGGNDYVFHGTASP